MFSRDLRVFARAGGGQKDMNAIDCSMKTLSLCAPKIFESSSIAPFTNEWTNLACTESIEMIGHRNRIF